MWQANCAFLLSSLYWDRLHFQKGLTFVFYVECIQILCSLISCLCSSDNHTMLKKAGKVVYSFGAEFEISLHRWDSRQNIIR